MIHEMKLNPEPFRMIAAGKKIYELRLNDAKRQKVQAGDTVIFTEIGSGRKLRVKVIARHLFPDFAELYKRLPLLQCGYTEENVGEASPQDMRAYYSAENEKRYGALALEVMPEK